jgi:hypothetical protein
MRLAFPGKERQALGKWKEFTVLGATLVIPGIIVLIVVVLLIFFFLRRA